MLPGEDEIEDILQKATSSAVITNMTNHCANAGISSIDPRTP